MFAAYELLSWVELLVHVCATAVAGAAASMAGQAHRVAAQPVREHEEALAKDGGLGGIEDGNSSGAGPALELT